MNRRGRIPGPIQKNLSVGNLGDLVGPTTSPWRSLDPTSPGWTFNDPGSTGTLTSINVSGAGIRFVLDKSNEAERWNAANQHGGRYYKQLHTDSGPLTWSKIFSIEFLIWRTALGANSGAGNQDDAGIAVGIADASCISDTSDVEWIGIGSYNKEGGSNQNITGQLGGDDPGTTNVDDQADVRRYYVSIGPAMDDGDGDGNPKVHRAIAYGLDDNNRLRASGICAAQVHEYASADPVYLFLCPTFKSNGANALDHPDFTYKVWYRISEDPELMLPEYIPNSG